MDISMKSLTHHTLTVAFHSLSLFLKKTTTTYRWLLPSVFCTIFVVVDVDLHTLVVDILSQFGINKRWPMSCCHLFRPCLVSKQKYIEGDCCQLCRSLWKCRSNQNGAHPYTNKTLNQLHTRVYMPGYSLMRQRDIIQQEKALQQQQQQRTK